MNVVGHVLVQPVTQPKRVQTHKLMGCLCSRSDVLANKGVENLPLPVLRGKVQSACSSAKQCHVCCHVTSSERMRSPRFAICRSCGFYAHHTPTVTLVRSAHRAGTAVAIKLFKQAPTAICHVIGLS